MQPKIIAAVSERYQSDGKAIKRAQTAGTFELIMVLLGIYDLMRQLVESMGKRQITPRLLTVNQAAMYLGLSPRTLYNNISRKAKSRFPIKPKRIGRAIRFDQHDLDEYLNQL